MFSTTEEFYKHIESMEARDDYTRPTAFGIGLRRRRGEQTLDVYYPSISYGGARGTVAVLLDVTDYKAGQSGYTTLSSAHMITVLEHLSVFDNDGKKHPNLELLKQLSGIESASAHDYYQQDVIVYYHYEDEDVQSPEEGYFKTQCLSQLCVKPHEINVSGIFGKMNNVAWTNHGPILPEDLPTEKVKYALRGEELVVSHVDKFPYMVNYHVPAGVRVVSGAKVRLGAHLSSGTTVMPAGYINFNAGTLGNAMIEGRVSAGVVVDADSDVGGGASIMGTLSGGNDNVISIGKRCLLGANAGTGISLGDGCTVAAGTYITAGAKVSLYGDQGQPVDIDGQPVAEGDNVVKGIELNGLGYMLYMLDSLTGRITARPNQKLIELNESLHV